MRDIVDLRTYWKSNADNKLVLCTLINKVESSYRNIGAKKIVALGGGSCGLLSGGCLEADIERSARERYSQLPFIERFSTMTENDRLFGYQAGCAGAIDILFEPLPANADNLDLYLPYGLEPSAAGVHVSLHSETLGNRSFAEKYPVSSNLPGEFFDSWAIPISLSIIGCGADAPSFAELAKPLGWSLRFFDYRESFKLPEAALPLYAETLSLDAIADQIPEGATSAVVLMTHNYEADQRVLAGLHGKNFGYVGCLGPRKRYEQMKSDLKKSHNLTIDPAWEQTVYSPAGIFNGGSPEEIALSILAQIQSVIKKDNKK